MKAFEFFPETMDNRKQFAMMTSNTSKAMQTLTDTVIEPEAWILYEREDQNGEPVEVLTLAAEGELFSTISATFIKRFKEIYEFLGKDVGELKVISGKSKAGRTYITCDVI